MLTPILLLTYYSRDYTLCWLASSFACPWNVYVTLIYIFLVADCSTYIKTDDLSSFWSNSIKITVPYPIKKLSRIET
jgi:hypothetical protein